jgi:hypothetical protein
MFGVAVREVVRPVHQFGGVGLHALGRFGKHAVERPDRGIGGEHGERRPLAPRRIGERVDQSLDPSEKGSKNATCKFHRRTRHGRGGAMTIV